MNFKNEVKNTFCQGCHCFWKAAARGMIFKISKNHILPSLLLFFNVGGSRGVYDHICPSLSLFSIG